MKRTIQHITIFFILIAGLNAQDKMRRYSKDWKMAGPEKSWNSVDHEYFYQWREKVRANRAKVNDDILRRQKAILNGNKITTEIWNYGSISSPGNRVTDIVWEGLGYGYEFGPFIGA